MGREIIGHRTVGYQIKSEDVDGSDLNKIYEKFRESLNRFDRDELSATFSVHREMIENPFRGKRASGGYLKFKFVHSSESQLFGMTSGDDYYSSSSVIIADHTNPFILIAAGNKKGHDPQKDFDVANNFAGRNLDYHQTDHFKERDHFKIPNREPHRVYFSDLERDDLSSLDFSRLRRVRITDLGMGTSADFEDPYFSASHPALLSTMGIALTEMPISERKNVWAYAATTDFFEWSRGRLISKKGRKFREMIEKPELIKKGDDFREEMFELMKGFAIPGTAVSAGSDYSGSRFQLFGEQTDMNRIVLRAVGASSMREVGHGTMADSTRRLIGFYKNLTQAPEPGPTLAEKLIKEVKDVNDSLSSREGKILLSSALEMMQ